MGISGLLPVLKSITHSVNVKEYAGKRAAVDTYCWLHRGAFTCSKELCENKPTARYIDYCMHRVHLLRHHGVIPILIFDGGLLPMKAEQERKRQRSRKENMERALEHEQAGNMSAAYECYQKAVDITPAIAAKLIEVLKQEGIDYIVAPYEADAQMAFLALNNHVDVVITEDSDLLAYGCPKVLFKMDKFGQGSQVRFCDLAKAKELNFTNFTKQMVLEMCIFSGCDYLPSLSGMGLKRAHGLFRRFKTYKKVIKSLRFNGATIPTDYEESFGKALMTFCHQRVYDPMKEEVVHLRPLELASTCTLDYVGQDISPRLAKAIARGEIDPVTFQPFLEDVSPPKTATATPKQSPKVQITGTRRKAVSYPVQKNKLSKYLVSVSAAAKSTFRPPSQSNSPSQSTPPENLGNSQEAAARSPYFNGTSSPATPVQACTPDFVSAEVQACASQPISPHEDEPESLFDLERTFSGEYQAPWDAFAKFKKSAADFDMPTGDFRALSRDEMGDVWDDLDLFCASDEYASSLAALGLENSDPFCYLDKFPLRTSPLKKIKLASTTGTINGTACSEAPVSSTLPPGASCKKLSTYFSTEIVLTPPAAEGTIVRRPVDGHFLGHHKTWLDHKGRQPFEELNVSQSPETARTSCQEEQENVGSRIGALGFGTDIRHVAVYSDIGRRSLDTFQSRILDFSHQGNVNGRAVRGRRRTSTTPLRTLSKAHATVNLGPAQQASAKSAATLDAFLYQPAKFVPADMATL